MARIRHSSVVIPLDRGVNYDGHPFCRRRPGPLPDRRAVAPVSAIKGSHNM